MLYTQTSGERAWCRLRTALAPLYRAGVRRLKLTSSSWQDAPRVHQNRVSSEPEGAGPAQRVSEDELE